jgi:signal transduction histidine kinase
MKLKDLRLGTKQNIGFGIILLILAGVNIFSIRNMRDIKAAIDEVTYNWLPRGVAASDINTNMTKLRLNQLQLALTTDETDQQKYSEDIIKLIDQINENLDTYEDLKRQSEEKNLYSSQEKQQYENFDLEWEEYQDLSFTFFGLLNENDRTGAVDLLTGGAKNIFDKIGQSLDALVDINQKDALEGAKLAEEQFYRTRTITIVVLIATIVISIVLAGALVRYITVPIQNLEKAAGTVADGNLDIELEVPSKDEIGNLSNSFNKMTIALKTAREKMEKQAEDLKSANTELEERNSDLERAMEQLRSSQEQLVMKEKMAGLGNLVAGVAHEINNPIGVVKSSTDVSGRCVDKIEIVLQDSKTIEEIKNNQQLPKTMHTLKENIKVTLVAGERVATIVRSLKNFARLDEADYQKVDIHEGIDSSITLLENEFRGRITVEKDYQDIPRIQCYPGQLNQVFLNLLKNASQAIDDRGTISVKTFRDDSQIQIQISDSGRGIPKEKLNRIFDFGFSAGGARVKMASGLSTAYNIVQRHDGALTVESELGKGTTFSIILPFK